MNFSYKNFFKPTPKKIKRLAWTIKAFTGSIGGAEVFMGHTWIGMTVLLAGAACDAILEFFNDDKPDA